MPGAALASACITAESAKTRHAPSVSLFRSSSAALFREPCLASIVAWVSRAQSRTFAKQGFRSSRSRRRANWVKAVAAKSFNCKTVPCAQESAQTKLVWASLASPLLITTCRNTLLGNSSGRPPDSRNAAAAFCPLANMCSRAATVDWMPAETDSGVALENIHVLNTANLCTRTKPELMSASAVCSSVAEARASSAGAIASCTAGSSKRCGT
mmetsp:Transcript_44696/g.112382  ORF Transcript_44696/g.112382 Transcript_44696/m.112382 type:complete len:212 (-) Transcript_44696:826-1461(-)